MAVDWYRRAAEAGNADAQFHLGVCYSCGTGVAQDARAAVDWYRRAADAGSSIAQLYLGFCYERGSGVDASTRSAIEWYRRAAGAAGDLPGVPEARAALARLGAAALH